MEKGLKEKLCYALSYEYAVKGKKEFVIGFLLGLAVDILTVLGIILAAIALVYVILAVKLKL